MRKTTERYLPYLPDAPLRLTPASEAYFEKLQVSTDWFPDQILEEAFKLLCQNTLPADEMEALNQEATKLPFITQQFIEDRQVAVISNVITKDLAAFVLEQNLEEGMIQSERLNKVLDTLNVHLTQQYYALNRGYMTYEFSVTEGYIFTNEKTDNDYRYDSASDYERQVSFVLNPTVTAFEFNLNSHSGDINVPVPPFSALIYPSNYTCSYRLSVPTETVSMIRFYRHCKINQD